MDLQGKLHDLLDCKKFSYIREKVVMIAIICKALIGPHLEYYVQLWNPPQLMVVGRLFWSWRALLLNAVNITAQCTICAIPDLLVI